MGWFKNKKSSAANRQESIPSVADSVDTPAASETPFTQFPNEDEVAAAAVTAAGNTSSNTKGGRASSPRPSSPIRSTSPTNGNYVAPTPVTAVPGGSSDVYSANGGNGGADEPVMMADTHDDIDDMVMVSKDEASYGDMEAPTGATSFTHNGSDFDADTNRYDERPSKSNHLNSLFNGHLMKWKFDAEEGTPFLRVPAFFGALGLIVTAIVAVVLYPEAWEPHSIVMTVCVVIMSLFVLILEGRFMSSNPLSLRAHLRNIMTRNFNLLRFVWGRGLLYIFAGSLNVAQTWLMTMISGGIMIALGFLSIIVGMHASRQFASLRNSLADESYLLLMFSKYDSDGDGYLEPYQFSALLYKLGMELDDRYTLKAFNVIDTEGRRRISFDDFNHWWTLGFVERGRRLQIDDGKEGGSGDLV